MSPRAKAAAASAAGALRSALRAGERRGTLSRAAIGVIEVAEAVIHADSDGIVPEQDGHTA